MNANTNLGLINLFTEASNAVSYTDRQSSLHDNASSRPALWAQRILPNASIPHKIQFKTLIQMHNMWNEAQQDLQKASELTPVVHYLAALIGLQALVDLHYAFQCGKVAMVSNHDAYKHKSIKLCIGLILSACFKILLLPVTFLPNLLKNIALYATFAVACLAEGCHKLASVLWVNPLHDNFYNGTLVINVLRYTLGYTLGYTLASICLVLSAAFHLMRALGQQIFQPIERAASAKKYVEEQYTQAPPYVAKLAAATSFVISMCLIGVLIAFTPVGWMHAAHTLAMSIPLAQTYITAITGTFFHAVGSFLSTVTHGFGFFARVCGSSCIATSANASAEFATMLGAVTTTAIASNAVPEMALSAMLSTKKKQDADDQVNDEHNDNYDNDNRLAH